MLWWLPNDVQYILFKHTTYIIVRVKFPSQTTGLGPYIESSGNQGENGAPKNFQPNPNKSKLI